MQVSLRTANALVETIRAELPSHSEFRPVTQINIFDDVATSISNAQADKKDKFNKYVALQGAIYGLRALIGAANVQAGIHGYLTQIAMLDVLIQALTARSSGVISESPEAIIMRVDKMRGASAEDMYSHHMDVSLLTKDRQDQIKSEMQKYKLEKARVKDLLLEANLNYKITVPPTVVETLVKYGLVEASVSTEPPKPKTFAEEAEEKGWDVIVPKSTPQ